MATHNLYCVHPSHEEDPVVVGTVELPEGQVPTPEQLADKYCAAHATPPPVRAPEVEDEP